MVEPETRPLGRLQNKSAPSRGSALYPSLTLSFAASTLSSAARRRRLFGEDAARADRDLRASRISILNSPASCVARGREVPRSSGLDVLAAVGRLVFVRVHGTSPPILEKSEPFRCCTTEFSTLMTSNGCRATLFFHPAEEKLTTLGMPRYLSNTPQWVWSRRNGCRPSLCQRPVSSPPPAAWMNGLSGFVSDGAAECSTFNSAITPLGHAAFTAARSCSAASSGR